MIVYIHVILHVYVYIICIHIYILILITYSIVFKRMILNDCPYVFDPK